jgi:hypothetical protein
MKEDNKTEEERVTREQQSGGRARDSWAMQIGEKVDVGIWCRKGSLGHGCPRTRSSEANGRAHYDLTYRIG